LLFWVTLLAGAILIAVVVVFFVLFYLRIKNHHRELALKERQNYWQQILFASCDPKARIVFEPQRLKEFKNNLHIFLWVIQKWSQMHQYVRGDADDGLQRLANKLKLETRILAVMKTNDSRRLIACCIALGDMQKLSSRAVIRLSELVEHKSGMVILTALRALMRYDAKTALPLLLKSVDFIAPERLVTILRECPPKLLTETTSKIILDDTPQHAEYLLRVLKGMEVSVSEHFIKALLNRFASNENIIAAALGLVQSPGLLPIIREHVKSPSTPIRIQATAALARLAEPQDIETLWQLVCDSSWWVRYRAAEGIFEQPSVSTERILARADGLKDEYAKTMLKQMSVEVSYGTL
tara:strand:+ start:408 stop:1466 length:1059 start_codon:yes stop_codon:yes gene_type:complete